MVGEQEKGPSGHTFTFSSLMTHLPPFLRAASSRAGATPGRGGFSPPSWTVDPSDVWHLAWRGSNPRSQTSKVDTHGETYTRSPAKSGIARLVCKIWSLKVRRASEFRFISFAIFVVPPLATTQQAHFLQLNFSLPLDYREVDRLQIPHEWFHRFKMIQMTQICILISRSQPCTVIASKIWHGNLGVFASTKEATQEGTGMVKNAGDCVGGRCSSYSYCNQKVMHLNVTDPPMHGSPWLDHSEMELFWHFSATWHPFCNLFQAAAISPHKQLFAAPPLSQRSVLLVDLDPSQLSFWESTDLRETHRFEKTRNVVLLSISNHHQFIRNWVLPMQA